MAAFDKLSSAFDQDKQDKPASKSKTGGLDVVRQSRAIGKAIDKRKARGVAITKKAELDYLLALRVLERADISPQQLESLKAAEGQTQVREPVQQPKQEPKQEKSRETVKRNPEDHPEKFRAAFEISKKTAAEVEAMLAAGQTVPDAKMEEYDLCKKFLEKYS